MTLQAFCSTCHRTVYVGDGETPVCPVCSSPLLKTIETDPDGEEADQADAEAGSK